MKNFIEVYDNALSLEHCDEIITYFESSSRMERGKTGAGVDLSKKNSWDIYNRFKNNTPVDCMIRDAIVKNLDDYKNKNPEINTLRYWALRNSYNIQKYFPGGGYFTPHCEQSSAVFGDRLIVWMIYLNTVTDGGGTNFPQHDLITDAVAGRLVIWPAAWTHFHHGIVSETQIKYIATGWFSFLP